MNQATLYLLVGYPGSGKTTTSRIIHDLTGAEHIWADNERQRMFGSPSHSQTESDELYAALNQHTEQLLRGGSSVVFDTNFSFRSDRDYLRTLAARAAAQAVLLWVQVTPETARQRATHDTHAKRNGYDNPMETAVFERIVSHLEPPNPDEEPIILDGTRIGVDYVAAKLGLSPVVNDQATT